MHTQGCKTRTVVAENNVLMTMMTRRVREHMIVLAARQANRDRKRIAPLTWRDKDRNRVCSPSPARPLCPVELTVHSGRHRSDNQRKSQPETSRSHRSPLPSPCPTVSDRSHHCRHETKIEGYSIQRLPIVPEFGILLRLRCDVSQSFV